MSSKLPRCERPLSSTFKLIENQVSCTSICSGNAHALAVRRRLRQGSVGARRRGKAARPRLRSGKYFRSPLGVLNLLTLNSRAHLVSQSLRLISTAIRSGAYRDVFETPDTIKGLIAGVVAPNLALRTRDVEAFEDTPLEYVRAELHVSEVATPRQATADVVQGARERWYRQRARND